MLKIDRDGNLEFIGPRHFIEFNSKYGYFDYLCYRYSDLYVDKDVIEISFYEGFWKDVTNISITLNPFHIEINWRKTWKEYWGENI